MAIIIQKVSERVPHTPRRAAKPSPETDLVRVSAPSWEEFDPLWNKGQGC